VLPWPGHGPRGVHQPVGEILLEAGLALMPRARRWAVVLPPCPVMPDCPSSAIHLLNVDL